MKLQVSLQQRFETLFTLLVIRVPQNISMSLHYKYSMGFTGLVLPW